MPRLPSARRVAAAALLALAPASAGAHNLEVTATTLAFDSGGGFTAEMVCDLDALALGAGPDADDALLAGRLAALSESALERRLERLRELFGRRVRVRFDGEPAAFEVSFPGPGGAAAAAAAEEAAGGVTYLGLTARLSGRVPAGAREMTFFASRAFPAVHLTVLEEGAPALRLPLERGEQSPPYRLGTGGGPGPWSVAGRYLALGFRHIVPDGADHVLFVLGLFLLAARWRPLLAQVSAFTAAHTLTLALAAYGVVTLPARLVETVIALSIVWVAVENVVRPASGRWRPLVVFLFGLLHGLGFAGALAELGLPRTALLPALLSFNVGVELGQLAVLGAAFLATWAVRRRPWYRARVVVPASLAIAAAGLWWALRRGLGL